MSPKMTPSEYVDAVLVTESVSFDKIKERLQDERMLRLLHSAMGLCTEAGEFMDALKKSIYYGKEIDLVNLFEEIGDLLWYVGIGLDEIGLPMEECFERNIAKLKKRYGNKFGEKLAASENRDLDAERVILEGSNLEKCGCETEKVESTELTRQGLHLPNTYFEVQMEEERQAADPNPPELPESLKAPPSLDEIERRLLLCPHDSGVDIKSDGSIVLAAMCGADSGVQCVHPANDDPEVTCPVVCHAERVALREGTDECPTCKGDQYLQPCPTCGRK